MALNQEKDEKLPRHPTPEEYQQALTWSEGQSLESAKRRMEFIQPAAELLTPDVESAEKAYNHWQQNNKLEAAGAAAAAIVNTTPIGKASKNAQVISKEITIPKEKYPETTQHMEDAVNAGHPDILTIDRKGAKTRRAEALKEHEKVPDKQLDEYPPAMFEEGGKGASVKAINPSDNMGAGACIGNQCRTLPDGAKIKLTTE